jgi:hypothetical protein
LEKNQRCSLTHKMHWHRREKRWKLGNRLQKQQNFCLKMCTSEGRIWLITFGITDFAGIMSGDLWTDMDCETPENCELFQQSESPDDDTSVECDSGKEHFRGFYEQEEHHSAPIFHWGTCVMGFNLWIKFFFHKSVF